METKIDQAPGQLFWVKIKVAQLKNKEIFPQCIETIPTFGNAA